ncbi:MAG: phage holin family protein [Lachnospiraceae bacterium]|nr:phage holin family protein [Lachnospiraceae bacterium]
MKATFCAVAGSIGSGVAYLLGGWTHSLKFLVILMVIDFVTGLMVGGVFHKSTKTETGALESRAGFKGICKKVTMLFFVMIGHGVDVELGVDYIKTAVCIAFMVNEIISITENAGLMGVSVPEPITNAIDLLSKKSKLEKIDKEDEE